VSYSVLEKQKTELMITWNCCKEGEMTFRYLGIPMSHHKLLNKDWSASDERFQKKMSTWKGKFLCVCGGGGGACAY
jgi:hypothetical protein